MNNDYNSDSFSEDEELINESNNIDKLMSLLASSKRTKLHTKDINSWLTKRCKAQTKMNYLYYPEELLQHESIKEIFQSFDRDGSNSLDIDELLKMFHQFNINITKGHLKQLFDIVDEDGDNALNFDEFKNCTLSERAEQKFNAIMRNVRKEEENRPSKDRNIYLPFSFGRMISHISYQSLRRDVLQNINSSKEDVQNKLSEFKHLISIQNIFKSDVKNSDDNKIKEKILLKNNSTNIEPLIRQMTFMSPFKNNTNDASKKLESIRKSILFEVNEDDENKTPRASNILKSIERFSQKKSFVKSSRKSTNENEEYLFLDSKTLKIWNEKEMEKIIEKAKEKGKINAENIIEEETERIKETDRENKKILLPPIQSNKSRKSVHEIPKNLKSIDKKMQDNLKLSENSYETKCFNSIIGIAKKEVDIRKRRTRFIKLPSQQFYKNLSMDSSNFSIKKKDALGEIEKINSVAFSNLMPKLKEIKTIQLDNLKNKEFKELPIIPNLNFEKLLSKYNSKKLF